MGVEGGGDGRRESVGLFMAVIECEAPAAGGEKSRRRSEREGRREARAKRRRRHLWKPSCGRPAQSKIWIGSAVKLSFALDGTNVMNVAAPIVTSGAVSPIAREIARMIPVRIPPAALGTTTPRIVCQRVAPSPKLASRRLLGTARSASCVAENHRGQNQKRKRERTGDHGAPKAERPRRIPQALASA